MFWFFRKLLYKISGSLNWLGRFVKKFLPLDLPTRISWPGVFLFRQKTFVASQLIGLAALAGAVSFYPGFFAGSEGNPVLRQHAPAGRTAGTTVNLGRPAAFNFPIGPLLFHGQGSSA
jgi:hypothetical protein